MPNRATPTGRDRRQNPRSLLARLLAGVGRPPARRVVVEDATSDPDAFNHITYASFGIDPVTFYSGKFAGGPGTTDYLADPKKQFDIEYGRARFLAGNIRGPRVLDIGCGSGPYAETLRRHAGVEELVGVDLDRACVAVAAQTYDRALAFDLGGKLPFRDAYFDSVFSCDVFGHIEFRQKDWVISEIRRVTKADGRSVHIIESSPPLGGGRGGLDYNRVTPDPDDPIRRYVWQEGHVAVESAPSLRARWSRHFTSVAIEGAMLYPFNTVIGYLANPETPEALRAVLRGFDEREREAAQVMLGYACDRLADWLRSQDPELLVPSTVHPIRRPNGLVNLVALCS